MEAKKLEDLSRRSVERLSLRQAVSIQDRFRVMRLPPGDFPVVIDDELRAIWRRYGDDDVRRLVLEVDCARQVMRAAHADALAAQLAMWNRQDGNLRSSIQKIVDSMLAEKIRLGAMGGKPTHR